MKDKSSAAGFFRGGAKKAMCGCLLLAGLLTALSGCVGGNDRIERPPEITDFSADYSNAVAYRIAGINLDLDAMDHYPQHIPEPPEKDGDPFVLLVESKPYLGLEEVPIEGQVYPESVLPYLEESEKITWQGEELRELIAKVDGEDVMTFVSNAAFWVRNAITYDEDLARQITMGEVDTIDAEETLRRGAGTCGEYANLLIAVLRAKGIPARYVHGVVFEETASSGIKSLHAWVEFYLQGYGWIPCDPNGLSIGVPNVYIKMYVGRDFVDIGVPISDIGVVAESLEE